MDNTSFINMENKPQPKTAFISTISDEMERLCDGAYHKYECEDTSRLFIQAVKNLILKGYEVEILGICNIRHKKWKNTKSSWGTETKQRTECTSLHAKMSKPLIRDFQVAIGERDYNPFDVCQENRAILHRKRKLEEQQRLLEEHQEQEDRNFCEDQNST